MSKKNRLYIRVSNDKYKHIIAMAETPRELARVCCCSENCVRSSISRWQKGKENRGFEFIEFDEDLEPMEQIRPSPCYSCRKRRKTDPDYEEYAQKKHEDRLMKQYLYYDNYSEDAAEDGEKKRHYTRKVKK